MSESNHKINSATKRERMLIIENCIMTGKTTTPEVERALKDDGHILKPSTIARYIGDITKMLKEEDQAIRERRKNINLARLFVLEKEMVKKLEDSTKAPTYGELISLKRLQFQVMGIIGKENNLPLKPPSGIEDRTKEECDFYEKYGCWPEEYPDPIEGEKTVQ